MTEKKVIWPHKTIIIGVLIIGQAAQLICPGKKKITSIN